MTQNGEIWYDNTDHWHTVQTSLPHFYKLKINLFQTSTKKTKTAISSQKRNPIPPSALLHNSSDRVTGLSTHINTNRIDTSCNSKLLNRSHGCIVLLINIQKTQIIQQCLRGTDNEVWIMMTAGHLGCGQDGSIGDERTWRRRRLSRQDGVAVRAGGVDELTGSGSWSLLPGAGFCSKSR